MRFGKINIAKETFYGAKLTMKIWNIHVDNIVISKLIETENSSHYLVWTFRSCSKTVSANNT